MNSGHGPRKSSPKPKTVCYSPRKRLENAKTTSFHVAAQNRELGSRAPKIVPGTQNAVLWPTKAAETEYRGSRAPKIVPGTQNNVLYPTKSAKNTKTTSFHVAPETVYRWSRA